MVLKFITDCNNRAQNLVSEFRTAVQNRLPDTFDQDFFQYRFDNPFFGYVDVENDACAPFYMLSNNDDLVASHYFWYGKNGYETASVREWVMRSKKATAVFDIGAHTGLFSLLACQSNPYLEHVVAFEPTARASSRIMENLIANSLVERVKIETRAISDKQSEVEFMIYVDDYQIGTGSSFLGTGKDYEVRRKEHAFTTSIDAYIQENNVQPDLLKIDVEGAEILALKGAKDLIAKRSAAFLIEVLPETVDEVVNLFDGYNIKMIDDHNNSTVTYDRSQITQYINLLITPT